MTNPAKHIGAFGCFVLAFVFYFISWLPGALGFALIGAFFELMAWGHIFSKLLGEKEHE